MGNVWSEIEENLGKLRRNKEQMTPEQRVQYEKPLKALQKKVQAEALEICKLFIFSGNTVLKGELTQEMVEQAQTIVDEEAPTINKALKVLFSTYDVTKFLNEICPVESRIFHEWYGPYWVSHCKVQQDGKIHNDIIDMDWSEEHRLWMKDEPLTWTVMLPPTMEDIMIEWYKEEEKNA